MGVYIPNMEKPKSCWECRLMDGEANCLVTDEGIPFKQEGILPDCPLIEIPTPHGRLIAEGSITDQLQKIEDITALYHIDLGEEPYDDTDEIMLPISTIRKILDRCITILEAEE